MSARMLVYLAQILLSRMSDDNKILTILKAFSNDGNPMAKELLDYWHMCEGYPIQSMKYDAKLDKITRTYERMK